VNIAVVSSRQSTALTHATVRRAVAAEPTARVSVLDDDALRVRAERLAKSGYGAYLENLLAHGSM